MSFGEFRLSELTSIDQGKVTITFAQLAKAETMIIVTLNYEIGDKKTASLKTSAKATAIVSCFEAWDIYKSLNK